MTLYVQRSSNHTFNSEQHYSFHWHKGCTVSYQGYLWRIMTVTTHLSSNFTELGWNWMLVLWLLYLPHLSSMLYVSILSDQSISQTSLWSRFNLKSHNYHTLLVENNIIKTNNQSQTFVKLGSEPLFFKEQWECKLSFLSWKILTKLSHNYLLEGQ